MDDIPGGELHGVETDRIGLHHRLHGFSPMNYFYFGYACKECNQGMHKIEKQGCIHGISSVHSVI